MDGLGETCDHPHCGQRAYTGWCHDNAPDGLFWCAHHDREHETDLMAAGWELWIDDRSALVPALHDAPSGSLDGPVVRDA